MYGEQQQTNKTKQNNNNKTNKQNQTNKQTKQSKKKNNNNNNQTIKRTNRQINAHKRQQLSTIATSTSQTTRLEDHIIEHTCGNIFANKSTTTSNPTSTSPPPLPSPPPFPFLLPSLLVTEINRSFTTVYYQPKIGRPGRDAAGVSKLTYHAETH